MKTINRNSIILEPALPVFLALGMILCLPQAQAGSASWNAVPGNGSWITASNWTPATVPSTTADTATFDSSTITNIVSVNLNVGSIVFNPGASAYTFTPSNPYDKTMAGAGIINNSGVLQTFNLPAVPQFVGDEESENLFTFAGSATAGDLVQYTVFGSSGADCKTDNAGLIYFNDSTTAGTASFIVNAGSRAGDCRGLGGEVDFFGSSSAENAIFIINGGAVFSGYKATATFNDDATAANATFTVYGGTVDQAVGGFLGFNEQSTAENATITANAGSVSGAFGSEILFKDTATAANATLIANGGLGESGRIRFVASSSGPPSGGTARIEVFGHGEFDISGCSPGVTTGSLEGDGLVFLGAQNLALGTNNLSTVFSGVIQDGGFSGGSGGSLTKTGRGNLTLTAASSYTGGTTVNQGILLANNTTGSATGKGPVQVNAGTFGGGGTVAGAVTVGTGRGNGAILGPGADGTTPGEFTIKSKLSLLADATYRVLINSDTPATDSLTAKGIRIRGAQIFFDDRGTGFLAPGTVFIVINNTSATAIKGSFANLADGETITIGNNNFQIDYQGGDGNDLTLTVVP
jgi:autotransporter-associated beta strand protein